MADWGTVVTQYPDVELIGGTQTQNVTAVGIVTAPHGVYLEFRIPDSIYNATQVNDYATGYSGTVEQEFSLPGVVGVTWGQTANAAGLLVDQLQIYVQSDSGNSQGSVTLPLADIGTDESNNQIAALLASLNEAEAL
jgi:hypothetical protein